MKAAAKGYFGKPLAELTLAQDAILAAIPQSPTKFDLVRMPRRSASSQTAPDGGECTQLQARRARRTSEVVQPPQPRPRPDEDAQRR